MQSGNTRVAVYRRRVCAPLARVWENVFDWEHLPWLHSGAFRSIEREDSGDWGWRARVGLEPTGSEILLELVVEREARRYVSRTLAGRGCGTEIWTQLAPGGAETDILVAFDVPDVPPERAAAIGAGYTALYTRLWDEDEAMMREREGWFATPRPGPPASPPPLDLGALEAVRASLPFCVDFGGRRFRILELAGELVAHSTRCPHWQGPLDAAPISDGCVRCPWHGYRFDVRTGRSADGRGLRLAPAPRPTLREGRVLLV